MIGLSTPAADAACRLDPGCGPLPEPAAAAVQTVLVVVEVVAASMTDKEVAAAAAVVVAVGLGVPAAIGVKNSQTWVSPIRRDCRQKIVFRMRNRECMRGYGVRGRSTHNLSTKQRQAITLKLVKQKITHSRSCRLCSSQSSN